MIHLNYTLKSKLTSISFLILKKPSLSAITVGLDAPTAMIAPCIEQFTYSDSQLLVLLMLHRCNSICISYSLSRDQENNSPDQVEGLHQIYPPQTYPDWTAKTSLYISRSPCKHSSSENHMSNMRHVPYLSCIHLVGAASYVSS